MSRGDWQLILLALGAVAVLVLLVTRWKVNAFLALALASLLVGAGAVALGVTPRGMPAPLTLLEVVEAFGTGLGRTLGSVAAIIGLGTMLGKLLEKSGGAEVLAERLTEIFGRERAVLCVMLLGFAVGLASWFAVGLALLVPIVISLTASTGRPFLVLAIPLLATLSVMHGLTPPHPGPVAALGAFRELQPDMGQLLLWAFALGVPLAIVSGPLLAHRLARAVPVAAPRPAPVTVREAVVRPGFGLTLFSILLPVLLMLLDTLARLTLPPESAAARGAGFLGHPTIALLASVLFASWSLGTRCGHSRARVLQSTEESIAAVGMTLLIVGAGGGFATVLKAAGVADAMGHLARMLGLPVLLYGWLVAAFIRVATGSSTVAITASAGLLAPVMADYPGTNVELLILAIGCGSLVLSHLNDGGFWIVKEYLGLTVGQTLRTWTVVETVLGVAGLLLTLLAHAGWRWWH